MQPIPGKCPLPFPSMPRNSHPKLVLPHQKLNPTVKKPGVREINFHGQQSHPRPNKNSTKQYPHQGSSGRDLKYPPNRVLQEPAPQISHEELILPRAYPTTLSHLRSGHCIALIDYRAAKGLTRDPSCPAYGSGDPHTVPHLFSCPADPTELVARDPWERPVQATRFLSSISSFHHLSALPPPQLEPPPSGPAL